MRYVVKDKQTGRFLGNAGQWTPFLRDAQRFPNGLSVNLHLENAAVRTGERLQVLKLPLG